MRFKVRTAALALIAGGAAAAAAALAWAQGAPLPWGQSSDQIAWETFVQVLAPSGNPATTGVEFETWASDEDIYGDGGPHWPGVNAPKVLHSSLLRATHLRQDGPDLKIIDPHQCTHGYNAEVAKAAGFPETGCIGEEVRRNWASYQYIVANQLYTKAGLAKAYGSGLKVDLPADAIEVKGNWAPVTDVMAWRGFTEKQVRAQYYVNTATADNVTTAYALIAFHFSSKQQKDWVWADFEHEGTPGRCDDIGCRDSFGAAAPVVKANAKPWQDYGACAKTPALEAMLTNAGTAEIWRHYCLKGSQVTFTDSAKKPTLLGNVVIEAINAGVPVSHSSCITCHAYASFDKAGGANFKALSTAPVGAVDPKLMTGFRANDFIWGNLAAK